MELARDVLINKQLSIPYDCLLDRHALGTKPRIIVKARFIPLASIAHSTSLDDHVTLSKALVHLTPPPYLSLSLKPYLASFHFAFFP